MGEKNWNWKGGITPLKIIIWKLLKSKAWRLSIFERDKFTCQMPGCNKTTSVLNAHHIKFWSKYPKLRYVVSNGVAECEKCHRYIHRF